MPRLSQLAVVITFLALACARPALRAQACSPSGFLNSPAPFGTAGVGKVAVADFNLDGNPDLMFADGTSGTPQMTVRLGDGIGGWSTSTTISLLTASSGGFTRGVGIGDFDRDGNPDIVGATGFGDTLSVHLGDGQGGFGSGTAFTADNAASVAIADLDLDGALDLVTTRSGGTAVNVLLGNGSGSFGAATQFTAGMNGRVSVGDLNLDGKPDLLTANASASSLSILLGDGTGSFGAATTLSVPGGPGVVLVEDFNQDGNPDLASVNAFGPNVSILLGNGSGGFGAPSNFTVGDTPRDMAAADFNSDGRIDLVTADQLGDAASVLYGDGAGGFGPRQVLTLPNNPLGVAAADFNHDGWLDLVSNGRLYLGTGAPPLPYQRNQVQIGSDIDGILSDGCLAARATKCPGEQLAWNRYGQSGIPQEMVLVPAPLIPRGDPSATPVGDQVFNVDGLHPGTSFLHGGSTPSFTSLSPFSISISAPTNPVTLSLQFFALDFSAPSFIVLSQGIELAVVNASSTTVAGPTQDDEMVNITLDACHAHGGTLSFYGQAYTQFSVSSNGRVMFGPGNAGWTAIPVAALSGDPFVGFWTDLNPQAGGQIQIDFSGSPAASISFLNVPYFNAPSAPVSYAIDFDGTSDAIVFSGLAGIPANPHANSANVAQFLGVSRGNLGSSDPGAQVFGVGTNTSTNSADEMLYDFWDGTSVNAPSGVNLLQSLQNLQSGVGTLTFVPTLVGGQPGYLAVGS